MGKQSLVRHKDDAFSFFFYNEKNDNNKFQLMIPAS